jgi:hypothetical protein
MEQLYKCYENIHNTNLKEYVSQFGNINKDGHLVQYCRGVHSEHWRQVSFQEFAGEARPEALVLIEFITHHKRLPNWIRR